MRAASIAIAAAITAFAGISATAGEQLVRLRQAPGLDKVEANCTACHSLDYVQMNSPFLSAAGWEAEVAKMINAFGALMDQSDAKIIIDYLNNNYGKESSISEKEKSDMSSANVGMTLANYDTKGSEAGRVTMIPRSIHQVQPVLQRTAWRNCDTEWPESPVVTHRVGGLIRPEAAEAR